jgi:hypothetical protein
MVRTHREFFEKFLRGKATPEAMNCSEEAGAVTSGRLISRNRGEGGAAEAGTSERFSPTNREGKREWTPSKAVVTHDLAE